MRLQRRGAYGFLSVFALAACGVPGADTLPTAGAGSSAVASQDDSSPNYLKADGSVDYDALRAHYGTPNENLMLNPNAVNVAQTPSVGAVTASPDHLTFQASTAGWLLGHQPGDVLYCNHLCGGHGFLRRIVSIAQQGDQVVVQTTDGLLTDVIWNGWLHLDETVMVDPSKFPTQLPAPGGVSPGNNFPVPIGESGSGAKESDEGKEADVDLSAKAGMSGYIHFGPSFPIHMTLDVAISYHLSWDPVHVDLVKLDVKGGPKLGLDAQIKGTASADASSTFWDVSFPLGSFPISVVEVSVNLDLSATWHASVDGQITAQFGTSVALTMDEGFVYTRDQGLQGIDQGPTPDIQNPTISANGKAGAKAGVDLAAKLQFKVYDLAGPQIVVDSDLGGEVEAEAEAKATVNPNGTTDTECKMELSADLYCKLTGSVGIVFKVLKFDKEKNWPIASHTWTFPSPKWTYEVPGVSDACAGDDGGTPDGGGTSSGQDGGGVGPGSDGGSNGSNVCGNQSCGSGLCRSYMNPNTCTANPGEAVGCGCSSNTDCNCGQTGAYTICQNGTCVYGCGSDSDCTSPQICLQNGQTSAKGSTCSQVSGCCML